MFVLKFYFINKQFNETKKKGECGGVCDRNMEILRLKTKGYGTGDEENKEAC